MTGENGLPETPDWTAEPRDDQLAAALTRRALNHYFAVPFEDTALPEQFVLGEN